MSGIDPLSEEFHENFDPGVGHMLSTLDGDVQSQGIQLSHRDWLDMGSEGWQSTPDEAKAAAYQAALSVGGWDDGRLTSMMLRQYDHLQQSVVDLTLQTLHRLIDEHPLHVEDVKVQTTQVVIQRRQPQTDIAVATPTSQEES